MKISEWFALREVRLLLRPDCLSTELILLYIVLCCMPYLCSTGSSFARCWFGAAMSAVRRRLSRIHATRVAV